MDAGHLVELQAVDVPAFRFTGSAILSRSTGSAFSLAGSFGVEAWVEQTTDGLIV